MQLILSSILFYFSFITFSSAYIGPGMGAGLIASILGIIVAIIAALFGIIYFPLKRFFKKKKEKSKN